MGMNAQLKNNTEEQLEKWLRGASKIVVLGIGNTLRKDDGVGVMIVKTMTGKVSKKVQLIQAETLPESFTANIRQANPSHILLVDAGEFDGIPGETRLVEGDNVDGLAISTHSIPLRIMTKFLEKTTQAKVALLAIQPRLIEFGEGLSPELEKATLQISQILMRRFPE